MFYLYVFALTLDLPSASIKCSTYVTSPTTNQIPETTHTRGEKPGEQWGFRADTSRVAVASELRLPVLHLPPAPQQQRNMVQVYKKQARVYLKQITAS